MDRTIAPLEEFMRRQQETDTTGRSSLGTDYFDARSVTWPWEITIWPRRLPAIPAEPSEI